MAQGILKGIAAIITALACALAHGQGKDAGAELVEVPAGALLSVELVDGVHSGKNKPGDGFRARLQEGVWLKERMVLPPGATVRGELTEVTASGRIKGRAAMALTLRSIQVGASTIPVTTDVLRYEGDKHAGKNAGSFLGGALQGAFFGMLFGGKKGAGVGAAAGAGMGAVTGVFKGKQDVEFEQGARLLFETTAPIPVRLEPASKPAQAARPAS